MNEINDMLKTTMAEIEQQKIHRRGMMERRNREVKRKMDVHRNIIIGELVCRYFPDMMQYQPHQRKVDNITEFAGFEDTLRWLSDNEELLRSIRNYQA